MNWIEVSERKPDEGQYVLVAIDEEVFVARIVACNIRGVSIWEADARHVGGREYEPDGWDIDLPIIAKWMPLPSA